jgi:hypothetical protein
VRLNELSRGKRGVTADTALRLAQLFTTTAQFWMHMQANFDLKAAMVRQRKLGWPEGVGDWHRHCGRLASGGAHSMGGYIRECTRPGCRVP